MSEKISVLGFEVKAVNQGLLKRGKMEIKIGPTGDQSHVFFDGEEIRNIESVEIDISAGAQPTRITIVLFGGEG